MDLGAFKTPTILVADVALWAHCFRSRHPNGTEAIEG